VQLVLCNNRTYEALYEEVNQQFIRFLDSRDAMGYAGIGVVVHEYDCLLEEKYHKLFEAVKLLHNYGYLKMILIGEDGIARKVEERMEKKRSEPLFSEKDLDDTHSGGGVVSIEYEDEDCAGGSCKI
tara:strand:- start:390 stop:770 length:381 start_codon:yes stop_codon:yes gene_type:complete